MDPVFRLLYPKSCPNVPDAILNPSTSWADQDDFKKTQVLRATHDANSPSTELSLPHWQRDLVGLFDKNFSKYASEVSAEVIAEGPGMSA